MSVWIHLKTLSPSPLRDRQSFQESIDLINDELRAADLPIYQYPSDVKFEKMVLPEIDTSRSELTQLKYVAARLSEDVNWVPPLDFNRFASNPIPIYLKSKIASDNKSHLLCNYHGIYVPLNFGEIPLPPRFLNSIGSSFNLKTELEWLANPLKLKLVDSRADADELIDTMAQELEDDPLFMSKIMIIRFYPIVVASIKFHLIICMD